MTMIPPCSSAAVIRRRANGSSSATMTRSAPSAVPIEGWPASIELRSLLGGQERQPQLGAAGTVLADSEDQLSASRTSSQVGPGGAKLRLPERPTVPPDRDA